jgi:hypothetical protein
MNNKRLILIKWIDSKGITSGWEYKDGLPPLKPCVCKTVGYVTEKTKTYITVVQTVSKDQVLGRITIPLKAILKTKRVKLQ